MNLSAISSSSALGRLLRLPLRLIPPGSTVPILQGPLRGKRWIVGSSDHGCWLGSYEAEKQKEFIRLVRPGQNVLDIGAHVGFYSLLASHLVGANGRVWAFEPMPDNVQHLSRHLKLNQAKNVSLVEAAVGDREGELRFQLGGSSTTGHLAADGELVVRSVALDGLYGRGEIPAPDLIKMDVEGAELGALQGATRLLAEARPLILLATHNPEVHRGCCDLLASLNYQLAPLDGKDLSCSSEIRAVPAERKL